MAEKRHDWFLNQVFQHRAALHRYLGKLTSGAEDIEDLVQETYVRIYALPDYLQVDSPKALLFRIAHNLAVERARRHKTQATDAMADLEATNQIGLTEGNARIAIGTGSGIANNFEMARPIFGREVNLQLRYKF
jgi:DNA-directed RNA polymerase specialized sigma24 family protein